MARGDDQAGSHYRGDGRLALKFLKLDEVTMIDEALDELGEYGEVRLVIQKSRLRFVVTQKSYDAIKWRREIE
jgi:hypothetical protein